MVSCLYAAQTGVGRGLSNDSGILLARPSRSQVHDLAHNLPASLPVRKRAPSSAVHRAAPSRDLSTTATRAAAIPC